MSLVIFATRAFKKLKIVDYLIIFFVIMLVFLIISYAFPKKQWVDIIVYQPRVHAILASSLHPGDVEKDPTGKVIALIQNIQAYDAQAQNASIYKDIYINVRILAKLNSRSNELEYKNKIIKLGSPIEMRFTNTYIKGTIFDFVNSYYAEVTKIVTLKRYSIYPWQADSLKINEGEIGPTGDKISEIISKDVIPAEITTTDDTGNTLLRTDPRKVDVTLKVKMKLLSLNGGVYLFRRDTRISIDTYVSFNAGSARVDDYRVVNIE